MGILFTYSFRALGIATPVEQPESFESLGFERDCQDLIVDVAAAQRGKQPPRRDVACLQPR